MPAGKGGKQRNDDERARVRVVAIPRARSKSPRCPPWPIRSRMARSRSRAVAPEMAGGRPPRPRAVPLVTNASRAKIVVARVRPTRAKAPSPSPFPQAAQDGGEGSTQNSSAPQPPTGE
ncbi:MAG: hypothetical protein ACLU37_11935 [Collinsella sp.]